MKQILPSKKIIMWRHPMRNRIKYLLASMIVLSLFLSACNFGQEPEPTPDVGAIFTAAAETVQAQFAIQLTQTALAAPTATQPPTATPTMAASPIPTFAVDGSSQTTVLPTLGIGTQPTTIAGLPTITPIAALATETGPLCNDSVFVADVTYPDGTAVKANQRISKVWKVQNTGTCTWDRGYKLVQYSGDNMHATTWEIIYKKEYIEPDEIAEITVEMDAPSSSGEHGGCWRMKATDGYFFGTPMCILINVQ
jgi:hypothetical protein